MNQRPILIQGAMEAEISLYKEELEDMQEKEIHGYIFYEGKLDGYPIVLSKTNVGVINVTASTTIGIINYNPCIVINQGVAGGITRDIHKGDLVIGTTCININSYQTPILEKGEGSNSLNWELKTFKEGIDELVELKADEELIKTVKDNSDLYKYGKVYTGIIGSGDVWNSEIDKLEWLDKNYNIICEDMETIGTYQICNQFKIPVIGMRTISDNIVLEESYDKTVGLECQKFCIEICKKIIKERK